MLTPPPYPQLEETMEEGVTRELVPSWEKKKKECFLSILSPPPPPTHTYIPRKVTRGEKRKRKNVPGQEQAISRILCGSKQYISIKRSVAHVVRGSQYLFQSLIPCLSKLQRLESKAHSSHLPLQLEVAIRQSPGQ